MNTRADSGEQIQKRRYRLDAVWQLRSWAFRPGMRPSVVQWPLSSDGRSRTVPLFASVAVRRSTTKYPHCFTPSESKQNIKCRNSCFRLKTFDCKLFELFERRNFFIQSASMQTRELNANIHRRLKLSNEEESDNFRFLFNLFLSTPAENSHSNIRFD